MRPRIDSILEAFDAAIGLLYDQGQRERFGRVLGASRASVERAVADLLADVAEQLNAHLEEARVDLKYGPDGLDFEVTREEHEPNEHVDKETAFSLGLRPEGGNAGRDAEKLT